MNLKDWYNNNTFHYTEFGALDSLVVHKESRDLSISLVIPTYNEKETVIQILSQVKDHLVQEHELVDELIVMDGGSSDGTVEAVQDLGIPVYFEQEVLKDRVPPASGKGEALWKSLYVTDGEIVAWVDADIENFSPHFVYGILGPLLSDDSFVFAKGFYERPLRVDSSLLASGGGRVTEILARPLLNMVAPELCGFIQPLSGEYAGYRDLFESVPFYTGYGVEIGLLLDIVDTVGIQKMAQVDLESKVHYNQSLASLSCMGFGILQTVLQKLEGEGALQLDKTLPAEYVQPAGRQYLDGGAFEYRFSQKEISIQMRPPMRKIKAGMPD